MTPIRIAIAAAVLAFAALPAHAEMKKEWVEYSHDGTKLKGYLAYDDKITGKRPAILLIHDRAGMQPYTLGHTETWAKLGYVSFAADFFGYAQGILPKDVPEAQAQMFGGMVGVEYGSTGVPLAANVAIHGSFADHPKGWAQNAKGKFLILHGAEDVPFPLEKVTTEVFNELRKAKIEFQMEVYSGAGHGFSVPKNKDEERANAQSIATTSRFLKDVFGI